MHWVLGCLSFNFERTASISNGGKREPSPHRLGVQAKMKKQRTGHRLAVPSAAVLEERIRTHLVTHQRQASQQFLVIPGILDDETCTALRRTLGIL
jgi:hypothetical protein